MLISSLGVEHAADALHGVCILYNNEPVVIHRVMSDRVVAKMLDSSDEEFVNIEPSYLTGWKSLKYPRLGYRKLDNGLWGWVHRASRSYTRGINPYNTYFRSTAYANTSTGRIKIHAATGKLVGDFSIISQESPGSDEAYCLMRAALCPVYDGKDGLAKLLSGETLAFIPSPRFMVEPSTTEGTFGIYMSETLLGKIDTKANITGPAKNIPIIENMVKRYAA